MNDAVLREAGGHMQCVPEARQAEDLGFGVGPEALALFSGGGGSYRDGGHVPSLPILAGER